MPRKTSREPERGDARSRLLQAASETIRTRGYAATSVDDVCKAAAVTKGSFFHHFSSKEALGVAVAQRWSEDTSRIFAEAPYHAAKDPVERVLGYVAFRRSIIAGRLPEFTCLAGTLVQEVYEHLPAVRDACRDCILGHATTLESDFAAALAARNVSAPWTAASLALHTQAVIQGAFVIAKAGNDARLARDSLDHLEHYLRLVLGVTEAAPGAACGDGRAASTIPKPAGQQRA